MRIIFENIRYNNRSQDSSVSVVLVLRAGGPGICCISISTKGFYWKGPYWPWCSFSRLLVRTGPVPPWGNVVGA